MLQNALPKTSLLRKSAQFNAVYKQGKRVRGRNFSLICLETDLGFNRIGVSVHGVKTAVRRNRFKRIVKDFFRLNREFIPPSYDIVFAIRRECTFNSVTDVVDGVSGLINNHLKVK